MSRRHRDDPSPEGPADRPGGSRNEDRPSHRPNVQGGTPARPPEPGRRGGGDARSRRPDGATVTITAGHARFPRRTRGGLLGPVAGLSGLVLLLALGTWALVDNRRSCGADTAVSLDVAAAPDIAPAVASVVKDFNTRLHMIDGRCVRARSNPADPAATATLLSGQGSASGQTQPDVWIPDSTLWVTQVRASEQGGATVTPTVTSVARSPIVAAFPRSKAERLKSSGSRLTWTSLLRAGGTLGQNAAKGDGLAPGSVRVQALDPARHAGGLAPLVITRMAVRNDPAAEEVMAGVIRGLQANVSLDPEGMFAGFRPDARGRLPVAVVPEQSVWKFNQGKARPAVAIYPADGTLSMDYPFTLISKEPAKLRAAELLRAAMASTRARASVQRLGFRTADGRPGPGFGAATGVRAQPPRALPAPDRQDVIAVVKAWGKLTLGTRMLALLDVSGSMATRVPGGGTRMEATVRAARAGLALYQDENEVGAWLFATRLDGDKDYRQLIPIGPLGERLGSVTRRQRILDGLGEVRPKPDGNTGLYDSIWAGYQTLRSGHQPDKYNVLLILTDGANDDPGSLSLRELLTRLRRASDLARPIMIIPIGVGPDIDLASMEKIAGRTGGRAYGVARPQDVQKVFIDVIARRACAPKCSPGIP